MIFKMYVDMGIGSRRIAMTLTERGIPTYKNAGGWTSKTIRRMLKNPLYCGILVSKKSEGVNFLTGQRRAIKDVSDYTFYKPELAIVSKEYFDNAQKILMSRRSVRDGEKNVNKSGSKYIFSTLILCGECGHSFSRRVYKNKTGTKIRWICCGRNLYGTSFCENNTVIDEAFLLDVIAKRLYDKISDKQKFVAKINKFIENSDVNNQHLNSCELESLNRKKDKYINLYIKDIINDEELEKSLIPINFELKKHLELINDKDNENKNKEKFKITEENFIFYIKKMLSGSYSNSFLKNVIQNIVSDCDGYVNINWK